MRNVEALMGQTEQLLVIYSFGEGVRRTCEFFAENVLIVCF